KLKYMVAREFGLAGTLTHRGTQEFCSATVTHKLPPPSVTPRSGTEEPSPPRLVHVRRRHFILTPSSVWRDSLKFFRHGPKRPYRAKFRHSLPKLQLLGRFPSDGSGRTGGCIAG